MERLSLSVSGFDVLYRIGLSVTIFVRELTFSKKII